MLYSVWRILFHLGKHISDDAGVVIWGLLRPRDIDSYVGELGP
jgi:hypothetical protein